MAACSDKQLKVNLYDYNIDDLLKSNNVDDINDNLNGKIIGYEKNYSETSFWNKIRKYGRIAGSKVVYQALLLYYAATKATTPLQVKLFIFGALGYFILPVDVLPDVIAGLGYTDDVAVILGVIKSCHAYNDEECKIKASSKLKEIFGDSVTTA
ncbi:conserved hypothetical protein [Methanocella paludicola SANAE]|uniref:DUF1232 domain-containing protein n=1 Tax=Methanocella paludicola (strain DSM 17711 / JCM 13418 / NBRC 101707 / SANAE) TaxID=304371 RepID=D1Z0D3_METPS|nr:YkvA family protein [Methanocella paludicola]BAI62155.1 conserved hypothetical protein [Methanocella paludicola SANAE]